MNYQVWMNFFILCVVCVYGDKNQKYNDMRNMKYAERVSGKRYMFPVTLLENFGTVQKATHVGGEISIDITINMSNHNLKTLPEGCELRVVELDLAQFPPSKGHVMACAYQATYALRCLTKRRVSDLPRGTSAVHWSRDGHTFNVHTYVFTPEDLECNQNASEFTVKTPRITTTPDDKKHNFVWVLAVCPLHENPAEHVHVALAESEVNPENAQRLNRLQHGPGETTERPDAGDGARTSTPEDRSGETVTGEANFPSVETEEKEKVVLTANHRFKRPILFTVTLSSQGPSGERLDGTRAGELPFCLYMFLGLAVLTAVWLVKLVKAKNVVFLHHRMITLLLVVTTLEFMFRWFALVAENSNGAGSPVWNSIAIMFKSARRAGARVLVLLVAYGWGITTNNIAKENIACIAISTTIYFCSVFVSGMNLLESGSADNGSQSMLVSVETFLDMMFYFWIFSTLGRQIRLLKEANEEHKLEIMRWFHGILTLLLFVSFWETAYLADWMRQARWIHEWEWTWFLFNGIWDIVYVLTLLAMLWLWRPTARSALYMFYSQFGQPGGSPFPDRDSSNADNWLANDTAGGDTKRTPGNVSDPNESDLDLDLLNSLEDTLAEDSEPGIGYSMKNHSLGTAATSAQSQSKKVKNLFPSAKRSYKLS